MHPGVAEAQGMFGLGDYGSDDERNGTGTADSDEGTSSSSSLDSAGKRAAEAEARLKDFGGEKDAAQLGALPSAFDVFDEVEGPPSFLDPEATRPLAAPVAHGVAGNAGSGKPEEPAAKTRMAPGPGFDISLLAPKTKGDKRQNHNDPRELSGNAVIEAKAKRYKTEDGPEATQQYTAAQIAMMGGRLNDAEPKQSPAAGPRVPSKPMGVSEFLNKGVGAAVLPRKAQDRKDKEKEKRSKGQSAIGSWKTEAEMVLRQQYDS